ncbi:MAG: hypothetical protein IJI97_07750 [Clostridia bacterium]|nr:hypothetical protein [Clostridia bacterium]
MLTLCHMNLPEGVARDDIDREISVRLTEINKLNTVMDRSTGTSLETTGSSVGASVAQQVIYGISATLALGGVLSSSYAFVCLGALMAFFSLVMFTTPDH